MSRDTLRLPRKDDFREVKQEIRPTSVFLVNEDPIARELVNRILNAKQRDVLVLTDKEWKTIKNSVVIINA